MDRTHKRRTAKGVTTVQAASPVLSKKREKLFKLIQENPELLQELLSSQSAQRQPAGSDEESDDDIDEGLDDNDIFKLGTTDEQSTLLTLADLISAIDADVTDLEITIARNKNWLPKIERDKPHLLAKAQQDIVNLQKSLEAKEASLASTKKRVNEIQDVIRGRTVKPKETKTKKLPKPKRKNEPEESDEDPEYALYTSSLRYSGDPTANDSHAPPTAPPARLQSPRRPELAALDPGWDAPNVRATLAAEGTAPAPRTFLLPKRESRGLSAPLTLPSRQPSQTQKVQRRLTNNSKKSSADVEATRTTPMYDQPSTTDAASATPTPLISVDQPVEFSERDLPPLSESSSLSSLNKTLSDDPPSA